MKKLFEKSVKKIKGDKTLQALCVENSRELEVIDEYGQFELLLHSKNKDYSIPYKYNSKRDEFFKDIEINDPYLRIVKYFDSVDEVIEDMKKEAVKNREDFVKGLIDSMNFAQDVIETNSEEKI